MYMGRSCSALAFMMHVPYAGVGTALRHYGSYLSQGQKGSLYLRSLFYPGSGPPRRCQTLNRSAFENHPTPGRVGGNGSCILSLKCVVLPQDQGVKSLGTPMSLICLIFCILQNSSFSIVSCAYHPETIGKISSHEGGSLRQILVLRHEYNLS